ncbi:unnamed protein product [Spirodela intermedia]|uniref:Uncharacterized protein n=1 Tax=Spirodela intermedia TaxID=51605 RepID=A0A7I8JK39_SPIIN|nr:unnamed protein product [Spirodela intermedia]CAA6670547.1 unnamed protein product [Spirodela intermedia]
MFFWLCIIYFSRLDRCPYGVFTTFM